MINRIFLTALALMFLAFGLWSITDPVAMTAQLGVEIGGPAGVFEMRGVFGGISLGGALMCAAGAIKPSMTRTALWFVATYMGGYAIGRGASLIAGDTAPMSSWIFGGFEAVVFVIAIALLIRRT
jgi:hypothetical protein